MPFKDAWTRREQIIGSKILDFSSGNGSGSGHVASFLGAWCGALLIVCPIPKTGLNIVCDLFVIYPVVRNVGRRSYRGNILIRGGA